MAVGTDFGPVGEPRRRLSPARFWSALVLSVAGIAILLSLGLWQVDRLRWKEAILQTISDRIGAEPVAVAELVPLASEGTDVEYRPARATGRFVHSGERFFLSTREGQAGWNVYTPLLLRGTDEALFVNRGFVPYDRRDPATRQPGQIEGEVVVEGLARNAPREKPAGWAPDNDSAQNAFFWRSVADMSEGLDLPAGMRMVPLFLDAGPGEAPGGYPVGGATVIDVPNNHLQYAITWFSLALVMLVMLVLLVATQLRRRA